MRSGILQKHILTWDITLEFRNKHPDIHIIDHIDSSGKYGFSAKIGYGRNEHLDKRTFILRMRMADPLHK